MCEKCAKVYNTKDINTIVPLSLDCENKLPAIWRGTCGYNPIRFPKIYTKASNQRSLKCSHCIGFEVGVVLF